MTLDVFSVCMDRGFGLVCNGLLWCAMCYYGSLQKYNALRRIRKNQLDTTGIDVYSH